MKSKNQTTKKAENSTNGQSVIREFEDDESTSQKAMLDGYSGVTLAYAIGRLELPTFTLCEYTMTPFSSGRKSGRA
jgi:hypothetical protein